MKSYIDYETPSASTVITETGVEVFDNPRQASSNLYDVMHRVLGPILGYKTPYAEGSDEAYDSLYCFVELTTRELQEGPLADVTMQFEYELIWRNHNEENADHYNNL